jgi:hypothetical protein
VERPIEVLRQLVQQLDQRLQTEQLQARLQLASDRVREAETLCRQTSVALEEALKSHQPRADQAERDQQELARIKRRLAELFTQMNEAERHQAEDQLVLAEAEAASMRQQATEEIERARSAHDAALKELTAARTNLEEILRKFEDLGLATDGIACPAEQQIAQTAVWFPRGQIEALFEEVKMASAHFDRLSRAEQHAQLRVWLGRFRRLQAQELTPDEQQASQPIFYKLVELSKVYQPGYIDAFDKAFSTNWNSFIAQAEQDLRKAVAQRQEDEQREHALAQRQKQMELERRQRRESGQALLEELKRVVDRGRLAEDEQERDLFRRLVAQAINALGASDDGLISIVIPYEDYVAQGSEFRPLRRNIEKLRGRSEAVDERLAAELADVLPFTRNRKMVMIGGSPREDARKQLELALDPLELIWESCEGTRPGQLESLEQRVRNGSIDILVLLRSFISHSVSDRLRPACQESGVACVSVDHGYGVRQIAEAIRRGPLRAIADAS